MLDPAGIQINMPHDPNQTWDPNSRPTVRGSFVFFHCSINFFLDQDVFGFTEELSYIYLYTCTTKIYMHIYIYMHVYIYIYTCIYTYLEDHPT